MKFNQEESMELISINHELACGMAEMLKIAHDIDEIEKVKEFWNVSDRLRNLIDRNLFGVN